jgi:predicted restriction endonuclease
MGRTPSSLAMKLCNFASLDPVLQARRIKGLAGATKQDREMWSEFRKDYRDLAPVSEEILHDLFTKDQSREVDFLERDRVRLERARAVPPTGPTEKQQFVKVRRGQQFFRQTILNAFGVRCAISGVNVPRLLVASHIKPWADFPEERLNPKNGLCLSSLHDCAFDAGLIAIDEEWRVVLSSELKSYFPETALDQNFGQYEGKKIRLPEQVAEPSEVFLRYHKVEIFLGP